MDEGLPFFTSFLWLASKLADVAATECLLWIEVPISGAVYTYASIVPDLWISSLSLPMKEMGTGKFAPDQEISTVFVKKEVN